MTDPFDRVIRFGDVEIAVHPRKIDENGNVTVALARCFFASFENVPPQGAKRAIKEAGYPPPTVVTKCGDVIEVVWRLTEPITDMDEWGRRQKTLIEAISQTTEMQQWAGGRVK